jgi:hypothetical protein
MTPAKELDGFIAKYDPAIAKQAKAVLAKMRQLVPGAVELVYDNYNALAIGFATGEKVADIVFSIALYPRWISLFFANGALKDPSKRLKGSGKKIRHIVLEAGAKTLDEPDVAALMAQALAKVEKPFEGRRLVIKSVSAKQRPRRPSV